jgi:hypothetical protein
MGGRGIGHRIRCAVLTRKGARSTGGGTAPPLGGVVPGAASDSGDACPDGCHVVPRGGRLVAPHTDRV